MYNIIAKNSLFKGFSKSDIEALLKTTSYSVKSFKKGSYIAYKGDNIVGFSLVLEGRISGEMIDCKGNSLPIEERVAGDSIATAFIFGKGIFPVDVRVQKDAKIILIEKKILLTLFQNNFQLLENFLAINSKKVEFLSEKINFNFQNKTIEEKILAYLTLLSKNGTAQLPLSLQQLSTYLGVSRPSLSRTIGQLIEIGKIEKVSKKGYKLL